MTHEAAPSRRAFLGSAFALGFAALLLPGDAGAKSSIRTPAKGSAERKAILDGMRAAGGDATRVFVVRWIRTDGAWAYVVADPQSKDGRNRYETESALLQKAGKAWLVVDQPCAEEGCDPDSEIVRLMQENPAAPREIFPSV
jgi:hypothetical protein